MSRRVVFTFSDDALDTLKRIQKRGGFSSMGAAVRESIQIHEVLQDQAECGFSEIVLKNEGARQEKTVMIPSLRRIARAARGE